MPSMQAQWEVRSLDKVGAGCLLIIIFRGKKTDKEEGPRTVQMKLLFEYIHVVERNKDSAHAVYNYQQSVKVYHLFQW